MIARQTVATIQSFLKPAVDAGAIPLDEYRKALAAMRKYDDTTNPATRQDNAPRLMRTQEAARILACSTKTVYRLGARGLLRSVHLTPGNQKSLRWPADSVYSLVNGGVEATQ